MIFLIPQKLRILSQARVLLALVARAMLV